MSDTPRTDAAERAAMDDTGAIARMEPIWETMMALERELNDLKSTKTDMQTTNIPEIVNEPAKMGCAPGNETIGYFAAEISRLRGELNDASRYKAAWDDFSKHCDRAHKVLDGKGLGKNVLEAALDEIVELRQEIAKLKEQLAESMRRHRNAERGAERNMRALKISTDRNVKLIIENENLKNELIIVTEDRDKAEIEQEKLTKEIEELKRQSRFTMPPGDGWVYTDQLSHEVSTPGPEIKWTGIEEEVKP